jgi:hypothetical protein
VTLLAAEATARFASAGESVMRDVGLVVDVVLLDLDNVIVIGRVVICVRVLVL